MLKFLLALVVLSTSSQAWAFPAKFSVSPDNSQELFLQTLEGAKKSVVLNIYMVTSKKAREVLEEKIKKGVNVKLLVEAEPFGGKIVPQEKEFLDLLSQAMALSENKHNQLLVMSSKKGARRYPFNHAKYMVIDEKTAYVSSENLVGSGIMANPRYKANRGWQTTLESPALARQLLAIFAEDSNPANADVIPYEPALITLVDPNTFSRRTDDNTRNVTALPKGTGTVAKATVCTSPKAMGCISDFMRTAKTKLYIQHLSLPLHWFANRAKELNPIVKEAIDAAKRGVNVRVMLNASEGDGPAPQSSNEDTIKHLNKLREKGLPIEAVLVNASAAGLSIVHNKGMVADGERAFVSSINGTRNSVESNREVAVALDSQDAAEYFGGVFDRDWQASKAGP